MIAVILVAGRSSMKYGFPPNAKPKCLYKLQGKILLEENIKTLNSCGIQDIRIVAGYKFNQIVNFINRKELNAEIILNEKWQTNALHSLIKGVKDLKDDVLCLMGDHLLEKEIVEKLIKTKEPLVRLKLEEPWGNSNNKYFSGYLSYFIFKIGQEAIPYVKQNHKYINKYKKIIEAEIGRSYNNGSGFGISPCIFSLFFDSGLRVGEIHAKEIAPEIDYYWQTDEYNCNGFISWRTLCDAYLRFNWPKKRYWMKRAINKISRLVGLERLKNNRKF